MVAKRVTAAERMKAWNMKPGLVVLMLSLSLSLTHARFYPPGIKNCVRRM